MATVNFSVPDEVKLAFDEAFGDQNKSAVVADLIRRAVRERKLQVRRAALFHDLAQARSDRPPLTSEQIDEARSADRP